MDAIQHFEEHMFEQQAAFVEAIKSNISDPNEGSEGIKAAEESGKSIDASM